MEALRMESFAHEVFEAISDLITDNSEVYKQLYAAIEEAAPDKADEIIGLVLDLSRERFNQGFFQGCAWSKGGGIL